MSLHPTLQHAKDALLTRRLLREKFGHHTVGKVRHDPLLTAYQPLAESRWFKVLYCPGCLRGHVVDLVAEVPADAPTARELGLRQLRPWRMECAAQQAD